MVLESVPLDGFTNLSIERIRAAILNLEVELEVPICTVIE